MGEEVGSGGLAASTDFASADCSNTFGSCSVDNSDDFTGSDDRCDSFTGSVVGSKFGGGPL